MKHLFLSLTLLFICLSSFSQIDEFIENVVLIQSKDKVHSGSGFLYHTGNNLYLLTAKHVLFDQENKLLYDEIVFYSYPNDAQKEKAVEYIIDMKAAYLQHKARYGNNFDIVAVQIGVTPGGIVNYFNFVSKNNATNNINIFSLSDCILDLDSIHTGDNIFMLGYPKSLEVTQYNNFNFNRPITRKGIVSGKDYAYNTILIDCPAYGGNSGGPILVQKDKNYKIIGLVSSYVPYIELWVNPVTGIKNMDALNSGLTIVTPFYRIINDLYREDLWE